jgi:hypothetical protein
MRIRTAKTTNGIENTATTDASQNNAPTSFIVRVHQVENP